MELNATSKYSFKPSFRHPMPHYMSPVDPLSKRFKTCSKVGYVRMLFSCLKISFKAKGGYVMRQGAARIMKITIIIIIIIRFKKYTQKKMKY